MKDLEKKNSAPKITKKRLRVVLQEKRHQEVSERYGINDKKQL